MTYIVLFKFYVIDIKLIQFFFFYIFSAERFKRMELGRQLLVMAYWNKFPIH